MGDSIRISVTVTVNWWWLLAAFSSSISCHSCIANSWRVSTSAYKLANFVCADIRQSLHIHPVWSIISKKVRHDFSAIPVQEKWTTAVQTPHLTRNELSAISLRHDMHCSVCWGMTSSSELHTSVSHIIVDQPNFPLTDFRCLPYGCAPAIPTVPQLVECPFELLCFTGLTVLLSLLLLVDRKQNSSQAQHNIKSPCVRRTVLSFLPAGGFVYFIPARCGVSWCKLPRMHRRRDTRNRSN